MNIADLRQEYMRARLDETEVARDPFEQFNRWFDEAIKAEHPMLNAMTLATVDADQAMDPGERSKRLKAAFVAFDAYVQAKPNDAPAYFRRGR